MRSAALAIPVSKASRSEVATSIKSCVNRRPDPVKIPKLHLLYWCEVRRQPYLAIRDYEATPAGSPCVPRE